MRFGYTICVGIILAALAVAAPPRARCNASADEHFEEVADAGVKVMEQAEITQPSDIDSIIVDVDFDYKITWKDDPRLVTEVYEGLKAMGRIPEMRGIGAGRFLHLNLKNGKGIGFQYQITYSDPARGGFELPTNVIVKRNYLSPRLMWALQQINWNQAAALRDARICEFPVSSLEARIPGGQRVTLTPCQPESQALITKAMSILDWLDARAMGFESVKAEDLEAAGDKRGLIAISPAKHVTVKAPDRNAPTSPKVSDAFEIVPARVDFNCDRIVILDYREWIKPQIAFRNSDTGRYYFVGYYLRRRDQERMGVEKHGWKGHPPTDIEYYKKPAVLYAEMEAIAKQAVEKYGTKNEQPPKAKQDGANGTEPISVP